MHIKCERTCIVCKEKQHQNNMTRIFKHDDSFHVGKKSYGRGAYICINPKCVNNLTKSKALNRAFKCNVSEQDYNKLKEIIIGIKQN